MHELGLVNHIIQRVEDVGKESNLTAVLKVTLELGEVSAIVPKFLIDYWQWAVKKSQLLKESELVFETIPAVTLCNDCQETYSTVKYGKQCPHCQSDNTVLLTGNEFVIREIEAC